MRQARLARWPLRVAGFTLAMLTAFAVQAHGSEGRQWIARMNNALATLNYDGVFTHTVQDRREVMRILHRTQNGRMNERVISTDGSGREFLRNGSEWVAYLPASRTVMKETRNRSYGYLTALNGLNDESERLYAISATGTQRLQGFSTRVVRLDPRDSHRYGYRFWLDEQTGMPVKTQLVTRAGEVVEEIAFISLQILPTIPDELFRSEVNAEGFRVINGPPVFAPNVKVAFTPRADLLPTGFRVRDPGVPAGEARARGPRTRFIVSDGIAWVSVFVEVAEQPVAPPKPGDGGRPDGVMVLGSTSAYSANLQPGYKVIVVGEVPPQTVRTIAEAVRPE